MVQKLVMEGWINTEEMHQWRCSGIYEITKGCLSWQDWVQSKSIPLPFIKQSKEKENKPSTLAEFINKIKVAQFLRRSKIFLMSFQDQHNVVISVCQVLCRELWCSITYSGPAPHTSILWWLQRPDPLVGNTGRRPPQSRARCTVRTPPLPQPPTQCENSPEDPPPTLARSSGGHKQHKPCPGSQRAAPCWPLKAGHYRSRNLKLSATQLFTVSSVSRDPASPFKAKHDSYWSDESCESRM